MMMSNTEEWEKMKKKKNLTTTINMAEMTMKRSVTTKEIDIDLKISD